MLVTYIVRGNIVEWALEFLDVDGAQLDPDSAFVTVNYLVSGARVNETIDLDTDTDGLWRGEWDSTGADPARVYWSARSDNPDSADDGFFDLTANLANENIGESI